LSNKATKRGVPDATVGRIPAKGPLSIAYLAFAHIASRTEPALCLVMSRHPFEARRKIQKVSSDVW